MEKGNSLGFREIDPKSTETLTTIRWFSGPQTFFQQQPPQQQQLEPVSEVCLGCICEAISSCDRNLKCEGDVCGMFRITWAYWADSGKPVLPGDNPNDGQGKVCVCVGYVRCTRAV